MKKINNCDFCSGEFPDFKKQKGYLLYRGDYDYDYFVFIKNKNLVIQSVEDPCVLPTNRLEDVLEDVGTQGIKYCPMCGRKL